LIFKPFIFSQRIKTFFMLNSFTLKSKGNFFKKLFPLIMLLLSAFAGNVSAQCTWTSATALTTPALDKPVAVVGTNLYAFAGVENGAIVSASQKFDGTTWTAIAALPIAVEFPSAVSDGTNIFIMGGALTGTGVPQPTTYRYNVAANTYTLLAPSGTATWSHAAVFLNGKIYKIGGIAAAPTNSVQIYDIAAGTWSAGANYPINVGFVSAVADNGFIYAGGGIDAAGTNKTYRYDPVANVWNDAAIADLPATRWGAAQAFYRGGFVMAGGYAGGDVTANISATAITWDPLSNTWNSLASMPGERSRMTGAILNDGFHVIGGRSVASAAFVGNTSNYRLLCPPLPPCAGTPNPGNTLASSQSVCAGTSVTLSTLNPTPGTGVTYQWQTSATAGGPFVNAGAGSTSPSYTVTPTVTAFYRVNVTCGTAVGTSTPIQVAVTACSCITPDAAVICEGTIQKLSVTIPPGTVQTFTSTTSIAIPSSGIATPYPSTLAVSGVAAGSTVRSVRLNGVTHTFPTDIDVALTSPTGVSQTIMSDVAGTTAIVNNVYTFDDAAPTSLTAASAPSGTYKPSNVGAIDDFPAPGPGATFNNPTPLLSTYTGNMNGNWNLYVVDDLGGDLGSISGYTITFASPLPTAIWTGGTFFTDAAGTIPYVPGTPATEVYVRPTATTTYTATIASGPCAGANNVTVTVLPRPIVSVSPLTSCGSATNTLTATGAAVYTWTPSVGLSAASGASVIANPSATTTYTVEGTATNGCKNTATALVNAAPTAAVISAVSGSVFQIQEGFTTVLPAGWSVRNNSNPVGTTSWFQGAPATFPAFNGPTNSYAAANFANTTTATAGDISTWLFTPVVNIKNGDQISFYTRTTDGTFPDRLEVRFSTLGTSVNVGTTFASVGDFTNLVLTVNPNLATGSGTGTGTSPYPTAWTKITGTVSGVTGTVSGRVAFRYFVPNGGGGANSDYIGIDQVEYSTPSSANCANVTTNLKIDITGGVGPFNVVYSNGTTQTTINNYVSGSDIQVAPGVTTTYSIISITGANGCVAPASTSTATITITTPASVTTQPSNASASCGTTATFTAAIVANTGVYQWQVQTTTGGPWVNLTNTPPYSGVTTQTLTINPVSAGMNGYNYRLQYTGACSPAANFTNAATLTVTPFVSTVTPASPSICLGSVQQLTISNIDAPSPGSLVVNSATLNLNVPDNNAAGVNSSLTVPALPAGAVITGVRVRLNVASTWLGDLNVNLKAPNNQVLNLSHNLSVTNGNATGGGSFVNTVIGSAFTTPLHTAASPDNPHTGNYKADAGTVTVAGITPNITGFVPTTASWNALYTPTSTGVWTIAIADIFGGADVTQFQNWSITIDYIAGTPSVGVFTGPAGTIFTNAAGTTPYTGTPVNSVYVVPTTTGVTNYQVVVANAVCTAAPLTIPVSVNTPVTGAPTVSNVSTCVGSNATFVLGGTLTGGPGFIHQYQVSTNNGVTYTNIVNGGVYSGANTNTLVLTNVPITFSGYRFRDSISTPGNCGSLISTAGTLTVNPLPTITISAAPIRNLFPGLTTTLTAAVSPAPTGATYQWFRNGVAVPGATSNTLVVGIDALGTYTVSVKDGNGCIGAVSTSTPANIVIGDSVNLTRLFIYPSPSTGVFQVRFFNDVANNGLVPAMVNVYDEKGSRVFTRTYAAGSGYQPMVVDLGTSHSKGVYRVDLLTASGERIKTGTVLIF
jgi:subtilisin-like proprotein convertase family protein